MVQLDYCYGCEKEIFLGDDWTKLENGRYICPVCKTILAKFVILAGGGK